MKILLAVDGSPHTKRMLGYVAAHDELFGKSPQFTALCVVPPVPPHVQSYLDTPILAGYYADEAKDVLEPVTRFAAQHGWQLETKHLIGHAGDVVADLAESGRYDLVVLGSHGHSAIANVVLGSTATRVLARCKTPAMIIR